MGGKSSQPVSPPPLLEDNWRTIQWGCKENYLPFVKDYQPHNTELLQLRILLHGPAGSGKSSFINSVDSLLQGRITGRALVDAVSHDSFTTEFNTLSTISEDDCHYNNNPTLNNKVHVLVCVVPANTIHLLSDETVKKMRDVRLAARDKEIPQLAILTKIDEACPEVKRDLRNVYKSKSLKKKMEEFSMSLGIPLNCIFPVKNYHSEITTDDDIDTLILSALRQMTDFGEDFVNNL